jgi:hypothetical protein
MKKLHGTANSRRLFLFGLAGASLCLGSLVGGAGSTQAPHTRISQAQSVGAIDIKTINKTTTLEVSHETTANNFLLLRIKNISPRDLNGYVVGIKNKVRITTDLSIGDRVIPPGQHHDMKIPLDTPQIELVILAAMFSDGSIEGESMTVSEIKQWRVGQKEQLTRSLSVIDAVLASPTNPNALDRFASQLHPTSDSAVIQTEKGSGSRNARDSLDTEIELLRERLRHDPNLTQRDGLSQLKKRIERRIASL